MTDNIRTIQHVKSKVAQYAPSANRLHEQDSGATEAPPALWKADLQEILEVFYVRLATSERHCF